MFQDRSLLVGPTAEMAEKLADRVVLVSRMLTASKSVGGAAYARTSESQAAAVKGLLLQTSLSLEHITAMLESIVAVPWQSDQHRDDVLAALAAGPAGAIAAKPSATVASCRRPMQDFGSIVNYYTEGQWDIMLGDATIPSQKLRVVLEHAHVLGLECDDGLRGARARHESLAAVVADSLEFRGLRIHANDIVFNEDELLHVCNAMFMGLHGLQLLAKRMVFVRRLSGIAAVWRPQLGMVRCSPDGVRPAACWCVDGDDFTILDH